MSTDEYEAGFLRLSVLRSRKPVTIPPMDLVIPVEWSESRPRPYLEYGELTPVCAAAGHHNMQIARKDIIRNCFSDLVLIIIHYTG